MPDTPLTPEQHIKLALLHQAALDPEEFECPPYDPAVGESVDDAYAAFEESDYHWDYAEEYRSGQVKTGLPSQYSRHYESEEVAAETSPGVWIGWTYWYGGGKHAEPGAIDWMPEAYFLDVREETRTVLVFSKTGEPDGKKGEAIFDARDRPWSGRGPTVEESGGESILVRLGQDLHRAARAWHCDVGEGWEWEGSILGEDLGLRPSAWRPMPPAVA